MRWWMVCLGLLSSCLLLAPGGAAEEVESRVSVYGAENAELYLQPLADALGSNLNSGLFRTARIPRQGLHFYIGVETMLAPIADDQKTFTASTEDYFHPPTEVEAPTIFGSTEPPSVTGTGGTVYNFASGFDLNYLPIAVPHLTVGSFLGTEATLRFTDLDLGENIGQLKLFGIGARHSLSQYFGSGPLEVAAGVWWQSFDVADAIEASAFLVSGQASLTRGALTLYGALGYETTSLDIRYEQASNESGEAIDFSMDSDNGVRLTGGVTLSLGVLHLHADYNLASQSAACAGIGLGS